MTTPITITVAATVNEATMILKVVSFISPSSRPEFESSIPAGDSWSLVKILGDGFGVDEVVLLAFSEQSIFPVGVRV